MGRPAGDGAPGEHDTICARVGTLVGSGDDRLSGDAGADANDGGPGIDRCRFDAADTYAGCELP